MQRAKSERAIARRLFSVSANKLDQLLKQESDRVCIAAEFSKLSDRYSSLEQIQNNVLSLWLEDTERDETAFEADINSAEEYVDKWYLLKQHVHELTERKKLLETTVKPKNEGTSTTTSNPSRHYLRLPKLELPKFDGTTAKWLIFWSQFNKIHCDEHLDASEKFHYLLQCMEQGSSARELVESFPPIGENYETAIQQLKERFARDELIIEHYVRELLQLVLAQTKGTIKITTRSLYDKLMTQILALQSLGVTQEKYAAFLYPLVESALPEDVLRAWSRSHMHVNTDKNTPLADLLSFVKKEVEAEERIRMSRSGYSDGSSAATPSAACFTSSDSKKYDKHQNRAQPEQVKVKECLWCDKMSHSSSECKVAMNKSLSERKEIIKEKKACSICLNKGHISKKCRKFPKCIICTRRHYTIMCDNRNEQNLSQSSSTSEHTALNQTVASTSKTVLLQTLKVKLRNGNKDLQVRALLDSGAQRSFVKSDVIKRLELKPTGAQDLSHVLFGGTTTKRRKHNLFQLHVESINGQFKKEIEILEHETICGYLPKIRKSELITQLQNLNISLSDCIDDVTEISLLIGSDILGSLFTGKTKQIDENLLAVETKLGWTLQGPAVGVHCSLGNVNTVALNNLYSFNVDEFWKLETLGIRDESDVLSQSKRNEQVAIFFKDTICVNEEGRYEVNLPWKPDVNILQPNYGLALRRLQSTTNKLSKLGILDDYNQVFEEWRECDIIEEVTNDNPNSGHYMPHHAVVKESSLTTKIRPVFDASAKDQHGLSLNSCLEKGINLIEAIPRLLLQFRRNAIGVTADIKKAFLQISLCSQDRDFLKFLWWRDINETEKTLKVFRHRRVVFGVTTSPFLLAATIIHHLDRYKTDIATKLKTSFYVDNCIVSVKNEEDMRIFISRAKDVMMKGKFELRCWVTGPVITDEEISTVSVLGLMWDPKKDELFFKMPTKNLYDEVKITKRFILSVAQSVFDPVGFACPTTIIPKLIIQKCWLLNIGWDQSLPEDLEKTIKNWLRQLKFLELCRVPRVLSSFDLDESSNSLHIFSDASQAAYAVCIFLRSELKERVNVRLVLAKSRVAPTKTVTIPRSELIAALMAVRLATEVKNGLQIKCKEHFWTDSSIVLAWLKRGVGLSTFVQNRVNEIVAKSNLCTWHHVPGELNPADLPSRGCMPDILQKEKWWEGPTWLRCSPEDWPRSELDPNVCEVEKEVKRSCVLAQCGNVFSEKLCYFSKYTKIVRMVGWSLRFLHNSRQPKIQRIKGDISSQEYSQAELYILKLLQRECFDFNENLNRKLNLELFQDVSGLFRVKTRLILSEDTYDFRCPILLSSKCIIVERLVAQKHVKDLHAGSQTLICNLRENYWIVGIRRLAKKIVRQCVVCRRYSAKPCTVPVAPLPVDRLHCGSVFEVTGVDLAGPLLLKSGSKAWVVLFTCATYRAVHLEVCSSLSTEDFLLALRRFLARRGNVRTIYSDNGTNLRGASNLFKNVNWERLVSQMALQKISWRHIPPAAPWWGGFWERLVKLVKDSLRRVLGKASLQLQELETLLCEVEALINSRPLTYIPSSTENLVPLTPAMFMNVGSTSASQTETFGVLSGSVLSARWQYLNKLLNDFGQRFRSEYLANLAQKYAGAKYRNDLKVGDVVLIGSDDKKRISWSLGVVDEIIQGRDQYSRLARVKTQTGLFLRPFQRLYPLELPREQCIDLGTP